jgi:signal transduction histidine kinase
MSKLKQRFLSLPRPVVVGLATALTVLIGVFDDATGREVALSTVYLIPICWAGWAAGRRAGSFIAILSTVIWLAADLNTGYTYQHPVIPYWNALMLLSFFLVVVYLLSALQTAHRKLLAALEGLQRANEGLEAAVHQRTAALQAEIAERKRLEIAKLQAERLAVAGTMAAEVAHEVRNPLGSILLNLDLIHKEVDSLSDTSRHPAQEGLLLVDEMRAEVHRIQQVIEAFLRFARLPKPRPQPVALNQLLDQKLAFMRSAFDQTRVRLHTDFDAALTTVNADAEQLWQALLNLIRNSLEAMPAGGELTVGTRTDGAQTLVRITDTGKGMTEEQLKRVFVPFSTTKAEGTGLGLTVVQQIINEHGGHVECESAPGRGSTFTIFLPQTRNS